MQLSSYYASSVSDTFRWESNHQGWLLGIFSTEKSKTVTPQDIMESNQSYAFISRCLNLLNLSFGLQMLRWTQNLQFQTVSRTHRKT